MRRGCEAHANRIPGLLRNFLERNVWQALHVRPRWAMMFVCFGCDQRAFVKQKSTQFHSCTVVRQALTRPSGRFDWRRGNAIAFSDTHCLLALECSPSFSSMPRLRFFLSSLGASAVLYLPESTGESSGAKGVVTVVRALWHED